MKTYEHLTVMHTTSQKGHAFVNVVNDDVYGHHEELSPLGYYTAEDNMFKVLGRAGWRLVAVTHTNHYFVREELR